MADRLFLASYRNRLVEGLDGKILEIGVGTGRSLPFVWSAQYDRTSQVSVHALEPDPAMYQRAIERAERLDLDIEIVRGIAETLPYQSNLFDVVIFSTVLCTVIDPHEALDEAIRVLRPGGELRVLEHVRDAGWRNIVQRSVKPVWYATAGGCVIDRPTHEWIELHPALTPLEFEVRSVAITPFRPFLFARMKCE